MDFAVVHFGSKTSLKKNYLLQSKDLYQNYLNIFDQYIKK